MKISKLWIPAIIIGIIGGGAKLCDTLFNYTGKGFFMDSSTCNMIFVLSLIAVLLVGIRMLFADRKIEIDITPEKNVPAAFFGFIASVAIVGSGVISVLSIGSSDNQFGSFISFVLSMLGGVVMLYESCICFTGQNGMKRIPYFTLALPAWACSRLIGLFIEYSRVSLNATEMFDVISVAFLALFAFYQSEFFAELNSRKCVGKTIFYGCMFVLSALITTADIILKMFVPVGDSGNVDVFVVTPTLSRILTCTMDIALCGFVIFFIISITKKISAMRNDEEDEDSSILTDDEFFGHLATGEKDDEQKEDEELGEPVSFSGTTLTLEDTLTMDRKEIDKAAIAAAEKDMESASGEAVALEAENIQEQSHEAQISGEEGNRPDKEFEPVFEVNTDVVLEPDNDDISEQTESEITVTEEPQITEEAVSEQNIEEAEKNAVNTEINEDDISEQNEKIEYSVADDIDSNEETNVFADENGDVDYDEVFRLLDEMSGNDNFT